MSKSLRLAPLVVFAISLLLVSVLAQQPPLRAGISASNATGRADEPQSQKQPRRMSQPRALRQLVKRYGQIPIAFEPNIGQADPSVRFVAHAGGYTLYLQPQELDVSLHEAGLRDLDSRNDVLRMHLMGAKSPKEMVGDKTLPGVTNYFIGQDRRRWRSGVQNFQQVLERGVYPGIDLLYHGGQSRLEYDFVISPGADPKPIQLSFENVLDLNIDRSGDLVIDFIDGKELRCHKPTIFQTYRKGRKIVSGGFVKRGERQIGFELGTYDHSRTLVIDPVLSYSTLLGGTATDNAVRLALDSSGEVYVVGYTASSNFPVQGGVQQTNTSPSNCYLDVVCGKGTNVFVSKLNSTGTALVYSTFLGGTVGVAGRPVTDVGVAIALDSAGNAYITGSASSTDFPTTAGAYQTSYPGGAGYGTSFVAKLDPTGSSLVYSTYLGGESGAAPTRDTGLGIAVDSSGDAYVTGFTLTFNFPVTAGAFQQACVPNHGTKVCSGDVYMTKLNPGGSALIYSTYMGGDESDAPTAIALDRAGNAYITGGTFSANFPVTKTAAQTVFAGPTSGTGFCNTYYYLIPCGDAFIAKLNPTGSKLVYSTFLGGSDEELASDIKIDSARNAFVTGFSRSTNFPVTAGAFQTQAQGDVLGELGDAFVTKLNPTGTAFVYSTYLGGDGYDMGWGIALDKSDNVYVAGVTNSDNFPLQAPLQVVDNLALGENFSAAQGATALFITELNQAGSAATFSTLLGGSSDLNIGSSVAVDAKGAVYVAGLSGPLYGSPTTAGAFQVLCTKMNGFCAYDALVTKVAFPPSPAVLISPRTVAFGYVGVGTTSPPQTMTITNQGNAVLNFKSIGIQEFTISQNTCGATLAAGASCSLDLSLHPTQQNFFSSYLMLTDNAQITPQFIFVNGDGVWATVSPTALTFAPQMVGTTSPPQNLTITNYDSTSLSFTYTFTFGNQGFSFSSNPCSVVASGATCVLGVVFSPPTKGNLFDSLTITDSAGDSLQISLYGTGT